MFRIELFLGRNIVKHTRVLVQNRVLLDVSNMFRLKMVVISLYRKLRIESAIFI